ncbi:MAG: InlB B-repeat-containing protein [Bacilli bacterium]|nr:InlB B-repeat-containing protein [Bacilli bacterium]
MFKERKKRKIIIGSLIGILLMMSVGYAAFQSKLDIKGSGRIASNWDVKITNVTSGTATGNATNASTPTWTDLTAYMEVNLTSHEDAMDYDVTITNNGTFDAKLEDVITTPSNSNAFLITFSGYAKGEKLLKGTNKVIHVRVGLNPNYTGNSTSGTSTIEFNYTQGEGSNIPSATTYLFTYDYLTNGGTSSTTQNEYIAEDSIVDLTSKIAVKEGYTFVGWNTDQNAHTGLNNISVSQDTTLYAIFKKDITITYEKGSGISQIGTSSSDYTENYTIYNNSKQTITLPSITLSPGADSIDGWYNGETKVGDPNDTYEVDDTITLRAKANVAPTINSVSTRVTTTTITAVTSADVDGDSSKITKYEYRICTSLSSCSSWTDNGDDNTYTFTGLNIGTNYIVQARVTGNNLTTTSNNIETSTDSIEAPTFTESVGKTETTVTINFPGDCTVNTCTYQKNNGEVITVTGSTAQVPFASSGTLTASISDGTNSVNRTYSVEFNGSLSDQEVITTTEVTTWTAPATGEYFLEVWGAQGGSYKESYGVGGKGGYSYGYITLNAGDTLYIHNGGKGSYGTTSTYTVASGGGTNGGGAAGYRGGTGGGASDIRVGTDSLYSRVIVAGGGGGAYSYSSSYKANGGYGGGETAGDGGYHDSYYTAFTGKGATQTAGGAGGTGPSARYNGAAGTFGAGGNTGYKYSNTSYYSNGAGGGGWYGGGAAGNYSSSARTRAAGGGGGSGYVYTLDTASNYPEGCLLNSAYYLRDAATIGGNQTFTSPTGEEETGHSGNGSIKISYELEINDRLNLKVDNVTTSTIKVTATPEAGVNITKYEFSSDNGATWTDNGKNNTYTFTGLTHGTIYNLKVRATTSTGLVVTSAEGTTNTLTAPTFTDVTTSKVNTIITYPEGCGSTLTCTYQKNSEEPVTVKGTTKTVSFTEPGTLVATATDGTNTVTETHTPTESITLSKSTVTTTNSITVTTSATSTTVTKYEFTNDGGTTWVDNGTSNVYTFEGLTQGTSYPINARITTNFGNTSTSTVTNVTTNTIVLPTYTQTNNSIDDVDVTITYPSGCGSTYTCTYTKNNDSPVTVTSTLQVVNYDADGELTASVSDGTNTSSSAFTVVMPTLITSHGLNLLTGTSCTGELIEDPNESGRYIYRGANPCNYITLGTETYRIMSFESDGTVKVIKEDSLGDIVWDPGYHNNISGITNSSSNNGTRYSNVETDYCYASSVTYNYGCKSWGSSSSTLDSSGNNVTTMPWDAGSTTLKDLPKYNSYLNVYLNGGKYLTPSSSENSDTYQEITGWIKGLSYKSLIEEHSFDIGPVKNVSGQLLAEDINQAHAYTWKGKVGLMSAIDYVKASTNSACTGVYAYYSNSTCYNNSSSHNYLYNSSYQWTISPRSYSGSGFVWHVNSSYNGHYAYATSAVRPALYLVPCVQLSGDGSSGSPYTVTNSNSCSAIEKPTFEESNTSTTGSDVTITYPSGCGSTYTCTYQKNNESPVTVNSTTQVVNFTANGEITATVTGAYTASSSYTVTLPQISKGANFYTGTSCNGELIEDPNEAGRYIYRGGNPCNYLTLGTDTYRIMSFEADGTIKVIKEDLLGNMIWDPGYSSNISGITSSSSANGTRYSNVSTDYCYVSSASSYGGCKSWGSSSSTLDSSGENVTVMPWEAGSTTLKDLPKYDSYINVYLNGGKYLTSSSSGNSEDYQEITGWIEGLSYKSLIEEHSFDIGPVKSASGQLLAEDIRQAHAYTWKGKVGLMSAIDYVKASTNSSCTGVYAYDSNSACYYNSSSHNYLYNSSSRWTISPHSASASHSVWDTSSSSLYTYSANETGGIRPVLYLSSNIQLTGNGTSASDAYTIAS